MQFLPCFSLRISHSALKVEEDLGRRFEAVKTHSQGSVCLCFALPLAALQFPSSKVAFLRQQNQNLGTCPGCTVRADLDPTEDVQACHLTLYSPGVKDEEEESPAAEMSLLDSMILHSDCSRDLQNEKRRESSKLFPVPNDDVVASSW